MASLIESNRNATGGNRKWKQIHITRQFRQTSGNIICNLIFPFNFLDSVVEFFLFFCSIEPIGTKQNTAKKKENEQRKGPSALNSTHTHTHTHSLCIHVSYSTSYIVTPPTYISNISSKSKSSPPSSAGSE